MKDRNNPELNEKDFSEMKPARQILPELVSEYRRTRGRQRAPVKERVSIRLDREILSHYRETGRGWQSRINEDLRKIVGKMPA